MYMLILMGSGWYCKSDVSIFSESSNIQSHIDQGETIAFTNDLEEFADQMGIEIEDITMT